MSIDVPVSVPFQGPLKAVRLGVSRVKLPRMNRLMLFVTSWPVQIPLWIAVAVVVLWPEEAWHWLRTLAFLQFLIAYIG